MKKKKIIEKLKDIQDYVHGDISVSYEMREVALKEMNAHTKVWYDGYLCGLDNMANEVDSLLKKIEKK